MIEYGFIFIRYAVIQKSKPAMLQDREKISFATHCTHRAASAPVRRLRYGSRYDRRVVLVSGVSRYAFVSAVFQPLRRGAALGAG